MSSTPNATAVAQPSGMNIDAREANASQRQQETLVVGGSVSSDIGDILIFQHLHQRQHRFLIGKGGYGEVLLGRNPKSGAHMAVKIFQNSSDLKDELAVYQRLSSNRLDDDRRELFAKLWTHGICPIPWIALSLGPDNLSKTLQSGGLQEKEVENIGAQLVMALSYLLQLKLLHLDVKPGNILWHHRSQQLQLIDFSLACPANPSLDVVTKLGLKTCCTPPYRPPEVMQTNAPEKMLTIISSAVDVWSMGCVLYNAFTAKLFFRSDVQARQFTMTDAHMRLLPTSLQRMVRAMCQLDARSRPHITSTINHGLSWLASL